MMKYDKFDLTGKVAVCAGGSSGLGLQFAKAMASAGADVAIVARRVVWKKTQPKSKRNMASAAIRTIWT